MHFLSVFFFLGLVDSVPLPLDGLKGEALTQHLEERIRQQGGTPLLEKNVIHFLYRGEVGEKPRIDGDFNFWSRDQDQQGIAMTHLGEGWFHFGFKAKAQARLAYVFYLGEDRQLDPRNTQVVEGWAHPVNVARMPDYPAHPELGKRADVQAGRLEKFRFKSERRRNERDVHVYTPAGYHSGNKALPVLYFGDGTLYVEKGRVPQILDNLIAEKTIPPVLAVFIDPVDRWLEYRMFTLFRGMMLQELIPHLKTRWRIDDRQQVIVGGSRGGLSALDLALTHPDQFMGCVAIAPAVTGTDFLAKVQRMAGDERPRFSILIGNYDYWEPSGKQVVETMQAKGYRLSTKEVPIGHDIDAWVAYLDDLLPPVFKDDDS